VFWHNKVDDMEPADFFQSFTLLKERQPAVYAILALVKETIDDQRAYIGFLRFFYVVWQCLETTDARMATQPVAIEDLKKHIIDRTQLLLYVGKEDDVGEFDTVMNQRVRDARQSGLLSYVWGGVFTEEKIFAVSMGVRWQIVVWLWAIIDTFDEQMD